MKKVILIIIASFISISMINHTFAQEKEMNEFMGRKGEKLEYREVELFDLDEDIATMRFAKSKEMSPGTPKLSIIQEKMQNGSTRYKEIRFYDENQNVIHQIALDEKTSVNSISNEGKYIITLTRPDSSEEKMNRYELHSEQGIRLWLKNQPQPDGEGFNHRYVISDYDGSVVEIADWEGLMIFYTPQGDTIKMIDLFDTIENPYHGFARVLYGQFSLDGQYFVVGVTDDKREIFPTESGIILFDNQGNELWRFYETEETMAYRLYLSPDNRYIMAHHTNRLEIEGEKNTMYLIDMMTGRMIKRYPSLVASALFTSDGEYALMNEGFYLSLVSSEDGEILTRFNIQKGSSLYRRIKDGSVSSEMQIVGIITAEERYVDVKEGGRTFVEIEYANVEIDVYHFNGVRAWNIAFPDEITSPGGLRMSMSEDGRNILVRIGDKIKKYQLVQ
ncbi:hypothetical protein MUP95_03055 [bacterium]|nr:hypothetical protein [bacterium]